MEGSLKNLCGITLWIISSAHRVLCMMVTGVLVKYPSVYDIQPLHRLGISHMYYMDKFSNLWTSSETRSCLCRDLQCQIVVSWI